MPLPWEEDYGDAATAAEAPPWEAEYSDPVEGRGSRVEGQPEGDQLHQYEPPNVASRALEAARQYLSPILGRTELQRMNEGERDTEGLLPAASKPFIPLPKYEHQPGDSKPVAIGKAVGNTALGFAEFFESPLGVVTAGAGSVIPAGGRLVAGAFAADLGSKLPEAIGTTKRTVANPNASFGEKAEAVIGTTAQAGIVGLTARHAAKGKAGNAEAAALEREIKAETPLPRDGEAVLRGNTKNQTPNSDPSTLDPRPSTPLPEPQPWEMEYAGGEMPRETSKFTEQTPNTKAQTPTPSTLDPRPSTPLSEPQPWEMEYAGGEMPRESSKFTSPEVSTTGRGAAQAAPASLPARAETIKQTPKTVPWYEQHGDAAKETIFSAMREIQNRVDSAGERERNLRAPQGSIAAGAAGFDEFIRAESQAEVLRSVRKGATPEEAGAAAKMYAREAVAKHNSKRPRDVNWARDGGTADTYIDRAVRDLTDAAQTPKKVETAAAMIARSASITDVLAQELKEHTLPAIWIDHQLVTQAGKYEIDPKAKGGFKKVQDLSKSGFMRNLEQLHKADGEGRWWGANKAAKELLDSEMTKRAAAQKAAEDLATKKQEEANRIHALRSEYESQVSGIELPKGKQKRISVPARQDGREVMVDQDVTAFGDLGIRKNENASSKSGYKYFITHLPTGLSLGNELKIQTLDTAKTFIKALIHTGVDLSKKKFSNAELAKLSAVKDAWFKEEAMGSPPSGWEKKAAGQLEQWADEVLSQDPRKRTRMGLDPAEESRRLAAVAIKGSYIIARGVRDFAQWSAEIIKQIPELAKAGEAELRRLYARAVDIAEGRDPEIGLSVRGMKLKADSELSEQVRENVEAAYTKRISANDIAEGQRLVTAAGGPERAANDILSGLWKPVDLPVQVKGIGEIISGLAKLEKQAGADVARANELADLQVRIAEHSRQLATTPAQWLQSFNSLYANYSPLAWLKEWRNGIDHARSERVSRVTGKPVGQTPVEVAEGIADAVAEGVRGEAPTAAEVIRAVYGSKNTKTQTPNTKGPETVTEAVERIVGQKGEQAQRTAKKIKDFYEREVEKFKRKHKIPELTPEDQRAILAEARAIERLPADSLQRREAVLRLLDQLHRRKGFEIWELPVAFWYAHTLSGPTTHAKNILGNSVNLGMEAGMQALLKPTNIPIILESLGRSLSVGAKEAASILKTGHDTSSRHGDKFELRRNPMELQNGALDKVLLPWKLVGRLLRAEDAVAFNAGQELRAAILSKRANGESTAAARRAMGWTPEARANAEAQATAEGLTGLNLQRRINEIIEQGRSEPVMNAARDFGYDVTFNNEPYGVLGAFTKAINQGFEYAPILKPFILPFTRIVANVSNSALNWTPVGTYRALRAQGKFAMIGRAENNGKLFGRTINDPLAIRDQHARALLGTAAIIGVTAAAMKHVFDQDPQFMVTGSGPVDKDQRNALRAAGWIPYSVKVGNRYYSYADKPPQLALAMVGHYLDAVRYKKLDQEDALNRVTYALNGSFGVLLQSSWLQGLSSLFNQANRDSVRSVGQGIVSQGIRTGSGFFVPAALKQLDQFFDPQKYSPQDVQGMLIAQVPFARRTGQPDLNVFGQPISSPSSKIFWSKVEGDALVRRLAGQRVFPGSPAVGDLSPEEHYALVKYRGPILRELLATRAEEWAGAPRLLAQDAVNKISAQATAQAKADLGLDEANADRRMVRKLKTK